MASKIDIIIVGGLTSSGSASEMAADEIVQTPFLRGSGGNAMLFFIQVFCTLGFAILYSTLVLHATKHLQLSVKVATTLMGVFGAFNYGLHLFDGYLGGRLLWNRNLFVGGMALRAAKRKR